MIEQEHFIEKYIKILSDDSDIIKYLKYIKDMENYLKNQIFN